jgi:hypothetical protein
MKKHCSIHHIFNIYHNACSFAEIRIHSDNWSLSAMVNALTFREDHVDERTPVPLALLLYMSLNVHEKKKIENPEVKSCT